LKRRPAIVDTNVVVAGVLTSDAEAPTARILDGMIAGNVMFVLSLTLLAEYRRVLMRERIRERHGLTGDEVDGVLTAIAANAIVREPQPSEDKAPDPGDQHLWDLMAATSNAILVTGDNRLVERAPAGASVVSPATFLDGLS